MKLRKETRTNRHKNGQDITKDVIIIEDDNGTEITRENWNKDHPLWGINFNNISKSDERYMRLKYNL